MHENDGSLVFWTKVVTTCQLTAVQILDDMCSINFDQEPIPDDIPVPVLTWFFWSRASVLVQAEQAMSDGPLMRDLSAAAQVAQALKNHLTWLESCTRDRPDEQNALRILHGQIVEALQLRPFHPRINDQTYGGNVVEPNRIQAHREASKIEIAR